MCVFVWIYVCNVCACTFSINDHLDTIALLCFALLYLLKVYRIVVEYTYVLKKKNTTQYSKTNSIQKLFSNKIKLKIWTFTRNLLQLLSNYIGDLHSRTKSNALHIQPVSLYYTLSTEMTHDPYSFKCYIVKGYILYVQCCHITSFLFYLLNMATSATISYWTIFSHLKLFNNLFISYFYTF